MEDDRKLLAAVAHGVGSFMEADLPILWRVARAAAPATILELGMGEGYSTRSLASVAPVLTIDPAQEPPWCPEPGDERILWIRTTAERYATFVPPSTLPFLFVDVDPHDFDQTLNLLRLYAPKMAQGGVISLHDIVPAREEIRVREAVEAWLCGADARGWAWEPIAPPNGYGIGVLRRPSA